MADPLLVLAAAVVGGVLTGWATYAFPMAANRRQVALQLLQQYTSVEFAILRHETWRISYDWAQGDRSCVEFFLRRGFTHDPATISVTAANGLTSHQSLSMLLHFFSALSVYYDSNLVDARLLKMLFEPHYRWYKQFFHEFMGEYVERRRDQGEEDIEPVWLTALPRLESIFADPEA
ncbi:MAG TPA: hypothetical protein VFB22_05040 [Candidatus Baltobacteraceae bacterium]|nr:hypothetical protein [Candidatus Baltobacteraceae bacterium]